MNGTERDMRTCAEIETFLFFMILNISNLEPVIAAKTADPVHEPESDTGRGLDAVHGTEGL